MSRIQAGSNATLVAVASIPPRIWEQDKGTWKAWVTSIDVAFHTKQTYKRTIAAFYDATYKSISQTTEDDINRYIDAMREDGKSESTIRRYLTPIRSYWRFAQANKA